MASFGLSQYQYIYELNPIVLSGGVASQIPGGQVSLFSYLQAPYLGDVTAPAIINDLDEAFAHFVPLPNSTLIDNDIGEYPFANQATAANAIVTKPLRISYKMICPARGAGAVMQKQAILSALQATLMYHNLLGGLYTCATPAFFWDACVMRGMRDITPEGESTQRQVIWQLDFEAPLVTQQQAQQQYNTLLAKIGSGAQVTPNGQGVLTTPSASPGTQPAGASPTISPPIQGPGQGFGNSALGGSSSPVDLATGTGAFSLSVPQL